jgi:DNA helicase-2/ATP-dependent DNA helicase PcrA
MTPSASIHLRPSQQPILAYPGGKMGISAVPGSGKTWTLSLLAADIILSGDLSFDQEVLVVTLVNSAVDNFSQRISSFLEGRGLLPSMGYRVRTLHGLAHDIVRECPGLVGLSDDFQIIAENEADAIREDAARAWLRTNPGALLDYLNPDLDDRGAEKAQRDGIPQLVENLGRNFISLAKDLELTPGVLRQRLDALPARLPLAEIGWQIYADYQRGLAYRGAVDFDDLIRLALLALKSDEKLLARLQQRWPFILEDEAQDSSRLQEAILRLLVGKDGNWVRVGDPNQAIYETFTTANPDFLRDFLNEKGVVSQSLPESGRSTLSIITLANHLVEWSLNQHPNQEVRGALSLPPIQPTGPDDPQPNPPDNPAMLQLIAKNFTPEAETRAVAASVVKWLEEHPNNTVAVLAPRNLRAFELVDELKRLKVDPVDGLLRSSTSTRRSAGVLGDVLKYLADPQSAARLAAAFKAWRQSGLAPNQPDPLGESLSRLLRKCRQVEDFLWPGPERDWLAETALESQDETGYAQLVQFRSLIRRWQAATLLPVDQVILTLAQDLFTDPVGLAVAHKLAGVLRQTSSEHADWRLPELSEELAAVARNERRFLGFSDEETGFDPDQYKGQVVVATMHKAKGLEWDRVYLMSVNEYDFPSALGYEKYISERWFVRNELNLDAEALDQLRVANSTGAYDWYEEGTATQQARIDYAKERLRLLYVGITRARQELVITWNTGRDGKIKPAIPLIDLSAFWEHFNRR